MAVVLTNGGEEYICGRLDGSETDLAQYVGWGTGAGTAAKGDTTLFTEVDSRSLCALSVQGTGASAVYQAVGTITAPAGRAITNAGLWTLSVAGVLVIKGDHGTVNLGAGDKIEYTFQLDPA